MITHRRRGSALMAAVALVFVLVAAVAALHHQQNVSRRAYTRAEAHLRFREGAKFALRERFLNIPSPSGLPVWADIEEDDPDTSSPIPVNYGQLIFEQADGRWSGLPNLKAVEKAHGHTYLELEPETSDSSLRVFAGGTFHAVETEIPGYAAYAPQGAIEIDDVFAWGNPTFGEEVDTLEAYSGVPAILGAEGDVQVGILSYGEAHSLGGDVTIEDGHGIGFVGSLPLPAYENDFMAQLDLARATLDGATATGDKTALISGQLVSLGGIIDMFFEGGGGIESLLSINQAFNFPFPMIPGGAQLVPLMMYEFWFHVPYPPDGGLTSASDPNVQRLQELAEEQQQATTLLQQLKAELDAAVAEREEAEDAFAANPSDANQEKLNEARDKEEDAREAYEDLTEHMESLATESQTLLESVTSGFSLAPVPQSRADDPSGRDGVFGWNYSKVAGNLLGMFEDIISLDFKGLADRFTAEVRVVHFGREDNVPEFQWGDTFVSKATWTVPRGRTLRYVGNMEIQGDLWLQRGSVLAVHGNLKVASPDATPSATDPFKPSGRVFLEEGATLVVTGDFECQGSSHFGSVMVGGEPGEIHPITAAILVNGQVTIPFGIYSGATIEDLVGIEVAANMVRQLLGEMAPNLAKIAGPFHIRNTYFARFATTFQLTIIPPTLFSPPIPVITPVPLPRENILVIAARGLSFIYTAALNLGLGENLYTHSDWWPFGDGSVPMATRIDPDALAEAVLSAPALLADGSLLELQDLPDRLTEMAENAGQETQDWLLNEVIKKLTSEVASMLAPAGFSSIVQPLISLVMDALDEKEETIEDRYTALVGELNTTVAGAAQTLVGNLLDRTDLSEANEYLREYSALLVYGRNIVIGSGARQASGMFIAEESIDIGAELTVGTLMARNGSIRARDLLYYPYFNQASLYVPLATPSDWMERAQLADYGEAFDSGVAVQVGPPPVTHRLTAAGWDE